VRGVAVLLRGAENGGEGGLIFSSASRGGRVIELALRGSGVFCCDMGWVRVQL